MRKENLSNIDPFTNDREQQVGSAGPTARQFQADNRFRYSEYLKRVQNVSTRMKTLEILTTAPDQWYLDQLSDIVLDLDSSEWGADTVSLFDDACFLTRTQWDRIAESNTRLIPHPLQDRYEQILKTLMDRIILFLDFFDKNKEIFGKSNIALSTRNNLASIKYKFAWRLFTLQQFPTSQRPPLNFKSDKTPSYSVGASPTRKQMAAGREAYAEVELSHPSREEVWDALQKTLLPTPAV